MEKGRKVLGGGMEMSAAGLSEKRPGTGRAGKVVKK